MQGLKSHAVTMFEVGKLSDESLDSFLNELEKVRQKQKTFFLISWAKQGGAGIYFYLLFFICINLQALKSSE